MSLSSGILLPASDHWRDGFDVAFNAAKRGYSNLDMLCIGDSWVSGKPNPTTPTQDAVSDNFTGMIADAIAGQGIDWAARYWSTGESLARHSDNVYTSLNRGGAPWTVNATAAAVAAGWPFIEASTMTGAFPANISHTFRSDTRTVALRFMIATYTAAQQSAKYSHRIDGGSAVQHTLKATASDYGMDYLDLNGLNPGIHTVDFGAQLAADGSTPQANTIYCLGAIETYNVSHGLRWGRMGWSGRELGDWSAIVPAGAASPSDKLAAVLGGYDGSGTPWGKTGFPTAPHLAILCIGINDANRGIPANALDPRAVYGALMYASWMLRRARPVSTLMFIVQYLPPPSSDVAAFTTYQYDWPLYRRAIRQAGQDANAAVIDLAERWGSTPAASGYMSSGDVHPLAAGSRDIYRAAMEALDV